MSVPTYDGDPSTTHYDLVDAGASGWNGHRYWLAHTPFPDEPRENPSIVVSDNLIDWTTPSGLTNPVVTYAEATDDGFDYNSDVDLVLGQDGTLRLYYRPTDAGGNGEEVRLKTSTDGVTWSAAQTVLTGVYEELISPAVVQLADGSFVMFTVDARTTAPTTLNRRTSADGVTWSAATALILPSGDGGQWVWHLDVALDPDGSTLHALVNIRDSFRLVHWTSSDNGVTWSGDWTPDVDLSPSSADSSGHYRAAILPEEGGTFVVLVPGRGGGDHTPLGARLTL